MKKVTYICDRCGTEFEEYDREVKISVKEVDDYDGEYWYRYLDLCPKCEKEMNVFFNNVEFAQENETVDPEEDIDWGEDVD